MGIMGNKGGVGVRMTLHNTSMCFINTHLAAHLEKNERRNQDFRDIENNMRFRQFLRPSDHDQIFWMGDLNYRIDGLEMEKVKSCVEKNDLENLLPYDQLHQQIGITDVFRGYKEGNINFCPTYKYKTGSNDWHASKQRPRIPSWCDRILYKGEGIKQVDYRSHLVDCVSDHKPVTSLFKIKVKVIDENKADGVLQGIKEKMDNFENR
uniref:Type II inositol 1,4,5-trisphosphate 5-phosphatase-like n=1 Tax=Crassostrea virginica TaxID=6565 RepID=A0A8B8AC17_CRAVI|nr:type II inositol 1,4,5-trisphosphate 5-phosphatase-like [Crassostrea virginica]